MARRLELPTGIWLQGCPLCNAPWWTPRRTQVGWAIHCRACKAKIVSPRWAFPRMEKRSAVWEGWQRPDDPGESDHEDASG